MGIRGLFILAPAWLAWACGGQSPSFTEDRSNQRLNSADGSVISQSEENDGSLMPEGPNDQPVAGYDAGDGDDAGGNDSGGNDSGMDGAGDAGGDGTGDAGGDGTADAGGEDAGGEDAGADAGGVDGIGGEGGVGTNFRTVEVTQQGAGKVDILWVVDVSGSMAEEQSYLGANFDAMISALSTSGHDFQTAITTTDVCQSTQPPTLAERVCPVDYGGSAATHLRGSFVGDAGNKVLSSGDANLIDKFNEYVSQGIDGSGFEHGLEAARLAIQKSLNGQNEQLVRNDAFLAVIVVSDEEDDGIGLWKTDAYTGRNFHADGLTDFKFTEDDMISYLQTVKGAGNFSVSAIAPTKLANGSLCSAPHSQPAEEGTQYIKAAQKSGGILQSICDTNWNVSLAEIGFDIDAQITQVVLPTQPDVATIKVKVDGVLTSEWTYNAGNNAVKFNAGHVPAVGAQIKITYYGD
jgi:hypothetical protein